MTILADPQIEQLLLDYPSRTLDGGMLVAVFEFDTFLDAIGFVNDVAEAAEQLDHHPDILIQYNTVTISTITHDVWNRITDRDLVLIEAIEKLLD